MVAKCDCGAALVDLLPTTNIGVPFSAVADLPPVVDIPGFPGANEPCRKHAFAITSDDVISMLTRNCYH